MGGDHVFELKEVSKKYGSRVVLKDITFSIKRGEIIGLIGASGAGKTTLLHMLVGFIPSSRGDILFRKHTREGIKELNVMSNQRTIARHYGFASQQLSFYEKLTVLENLRYFGRMYDLESNTIEKNANQLLQFMQLKSSAHLLAAHLSGGMKRRLDIACALIHNPSIIILDEPTADLDPVLRNHIWEVIKQINSRGTTVILSSHHLHDLDALCTRIGIIKDGHLVDIDTPDKLKNKYSSEQEIMVESFPGNYDKIIKKLESARISVKREGTYMTIKTENAANVINKVLALLQRNNESLLDLKLIKPNIDDVFVSIYKDKKKGEGHPTVGCVENMKFHTTIAKNLKLLFRSRESAYTIIFGPVLIILIVSFAFMGSSDSFTVNVGIFAEEHTEFSDKTVNLLNKNNYLVSVYPSLDMCIESVKEGNTHACLKFGVAEPDKSVPVQFHLDLSRINIVYQIIDDLSQELDVQADAIRRQIASDTELRMESAASLVDESKDRAEGLVAAFEAVSAELSTARDAVDMIPTHTRNVTDLRIIKGYQQGFAQSIKLISNEAVEALKEAKRMITELENRCDNCPDGVFTDIERVDEIIDEAKSEILYISEDLTPGQQEEVSLLLRYAIEDLESIQGTIDNASVAGKAVNAGVNQGFDTIDSGGVEMRQIVARLDYTSKFLRGEEVDQEYLSAPVATSIVSITASDDSLSFVYPYLLILVIMFIGMLLSSMLVVTDKTSHAAFRNFTTPTSDGYHVVMSFLTAFLILVVETIIILFISGFFITQPLLLNPFPTLFIIGVAIIIFTFFGMLIGYLSSTQEAAMIASISISSVLLFVSNLVIPLEGMASMARLISEINPYIILSELLKKSMLYGVSMNQVGQQMVTLALFTIALIVVTVLVQRKIKNNYFRQEEQLLPMIKHVPEPLILGERYIHNAADLMDALDKMTRNEFEVTVATKGDVITKWVKKELRNPLLARQLRTTSKEKMILKLDRYLKRHGKHIKR